MEGSPLAPRPSDPTKAIINVDGESSKKLLGLIDDDYLPEDCDLTPEQIASFREAFFTVDTDEDGLINAAELSCAMAELGVTRPMKQVEAMLEELDVMKRGVIQLPQFMILMERYSHNKDEEEKQLIAAFKLFDKTGRGVLLARELRHILTSMGEKLTEQEVDELIKEVDVDGSGEISCHDFAGILTARGAG